MSGFQDLAWRLGSFRGSNLLPYILNFATNSFDAAWIAPNWVVSGGTAKNTPTEGVEKLSNVEFTTNTAGWSTTDVSITRVDSEVDPGVNSGGVDKWALKVQKTAASFATRATQAIAGLSTGSWFRASARLYAPSANTASNAANVGCLGAVSGSSQVSAEDTWQGLNGTGRVTGTLTFLLAVGGSTNGDVAYFDAVSFKLLSALVALKNFNENDVIAKGAWTIGAQYQAGSIALSDGTFGNCLAAIYDRKTGNAVLLQYVAGVYSQLISTAVAYSAGAFAEVRVSSNGTVAKLYYNGSQVGANQTPNVTIQTNTYAGLFSTDISNTCSQFQCLKN